jgi:D-inositol-3-phosphate glycosyltransferase
MIMFHTLGAAKNAVGLGEAESELRIATERRLVETADRVIAATEKEKWTLARDYGCSDGKIGVVPCGVDLELFRPVDKALARRKLKLGSGRMILFVGRMEPLKGIDNLLLAGSRLRHIPGLRMLLLGGDRHSLAEASRLKALAHDLGLDGSVLFLGSVRQDLLPYFYSAADACVIPSHYESFSLVALESLACGTPVVATDVGDLKNIIHDGVSGYVVPVNDPGRLAGGIESLLSWPSRDSGSASAISESVGRFSWPNIATAIMEECRTMLAAHQTQGRGPAYVRTTGCVS